jgi:hypothetical protein
MVNYHFPSKIKSRWRLEQEKEMRSIIPLFAVALAVTPGAPPAAFAATSKLTPAQRREAQDRAKNPQSFDACVQLAMQRGFSVSDYDYRESARKFVRACMAGKQS